MFVPLSTVRKGRGALSNQTCRYDSNRYEAVADEWDSIDPDPLPLQTVCHMDTSRNVINKSESKDLYFEQSINPYRGCEHGCIYCYARPSHAYWGMSPGLDFETQIWYKPNAAALVTATFDKPTYVCKTIVIGSNTDPYQPVERDLRVTRSLLEVFLRYKHPVYLITKSMNILQDIDLLSQLAKLQLGAVCISLTTLDKQLAQEMEPRAATPHNRLKTIAALTNAGVPVTVLTSPMIPGLNDQELEKLLEAGRQAGAANAGYTLVRLPLELKDLFQEWLEQHKPDRAKHILSLIRQCQEGKLYNAVPGVRMKGSGTYAELLAQRFRRAYQALGFSSEATKLDRQKFTRSPSQLTLF